MFARLIMCNIPASQNDTPAALKFYGALLGRDLVRSLREDIVTHHAPASAGVQLSVGLKHSAHESVSCYFAVPDLKDAIRHLQAAGGKIVVEAFQLPVKVRGLAAGGAAAGCKNQAFFGDPAPDLGQVVILQDPAGNLVGIVQLNKTAEVWFQSHVTPVQIESYHHGADLARQLIGH